LGRFDRRSEFANLVVRPAVPNIIMLKYRLGASLLLAVAGCSVTVTSPPSQGADVLTNTCRTDASVSCVGGGTGYSCTTTEAPDQHDSALACGEGVARGNGETAFCCVPVSGFASGGSCAVDPAVQGCVNGSYGFSCTGSSTPDKADASLICSSGTPASSGLTLYCCLYTAAMSSCTSDPSVTSGCKGEGASYGFSCTGSDAPDKTFGYLVCGQSAPGPNGTSLYCCNDNATIAPTMPTCAMDSTIACGGGLAGYTCASGATPAASLNCGAGTAVPNGGMSYCCGTAASCAANASVTGCQGGSTGYSCTGGTTPDASLNCGSGVAGPTGDTYYCCGGAAGTCMQDATVAGCSGTSKGYSCTGALSPSATDATLVCSVGTAGANGSTSYCCLTNASTTCKQDSSVQGCAGNSYGFSCSGADTPAQANMSLTCSAGTAGNGGLTLYCCR